MTTSQRIPTTKQNGFTLMELMIVVAIMAVLTMAAIPSLQNYLATARLNVHLNNFEEAQRFVAGECSKAIAGGTKINIVETLNGNGKKYAPGNDTDAPAFATPDTASTDASGQVLIDGLESDQVKPGTDITISLGTAATGATPDQYPGGTETDMPGESTINCASN